MKEIPLTQGKVALVDDDDFAYLSQFKWYAQKNFNTFYAQRHVRVNGRQYHISMHRVVACTSVGMHTDHIDGNGLNNTKANLRSCTNRENHYNTARPITATLPYKGISRANSKWRASLQVDRKLVYIGVFPTMEEAARAYDRRAKELWGEYARLNFPDAA
jgi:hypothetical protein